MAETVREVPYYYITASNKPGEGAALAAMLKEAGVSLLAVHAFPERRRVQVDIVPEDARAFTAAARKAKLKLSPRKKAFLVEGTDRTGALIPILGKLADAGINITAITAIAAGRKRYGAIFWVNPKDQGRAKRVLGA